jgi:hypothetical protein
MDKKLFTSYAMDLDSGDEIMLPGWSSRGVHYSVVSVDEIDYSDAVAVSIKAMGADVLVLTLHLHYRVAVSR